MCGKIIRANPAFDKVTLFNNNLYDIVHGIVELL